MKYYFTSSEARQHLGIDIGAFYHLVNTGRIQRLTPPGKKRGFYSRHEIDRLKYITSQEAAGMGIRFMRATPDDIQEEYELATLTLNGSAGYVGYGVPIYKAWSGKNSDTNFIVRDQGRLVAFMHVLPVKREIIQQWMRGEKREWEIRAEDVLLYTQGSSVECILMSMVTTSGVDRWKRRLYGALLMRGFLHFLSDLARQNTTITRFYAIGATTEGIAVLKRAHFQEKGRMGKRVAFELNPITSESRLAKAYRSALQIATDGGGAK